MNSDNLLHATWTFPLMISYHHKFKCQRLAATSFVRLLAGAYQLMFRGDQRVVKIQKQNNIYKKKKNLVFTLFTFVVFLFLLFIFLSAVLLLCSTRTAGQHLQLILLVARSLLFSRICHLLRWSFGGSRSFPRSHLCCGPLQCHFIWKCHCRLS